MSNHYEFIDKKTMKVNENSLGYQQLITTLTAVGRKVSEQRFFEVNLADYVPVVVGNGSYMRQIINWRTFVKGEGFESCIISNASNNSKLDQVDAAYDQFSQNIHSFAAKIEYNVFELEEAARANTLFSLIEARELARRKTWQLGIQKTAFLGYGSDKGLLNQTSVYADSSTLTGFIKGLSAANFNTFVGAIWEKYRANCAYSAKATHFILPEADYNGLVGWPDSTYPLRTKLELLTEAFKTVSGNNNFKILPNAYANKANNGTGNNIYVLLNYDETSVKMDLPIDYTMTQSGTVNGFTWENVAFGQFTGVAAIRDKEMYYLTHSA